jgi:hypothetical protein
LYRNHQGPSFPGKNVEDIGDCGSGVDEEDRNY